MTRARYVSNPQAIDIPLTVSANLTANAVITVGNSSVNSVITSNTYSVGSNVSLSTSRLFLGNSTVNSVHTASTLDVGANVNLSTVGLNVGSNTVNAYINSTSFAIGNSTVNTAITSTTITSTALLSIGNTNVTGTANVSTGINVGANVNLSTSQINVGNATVNTVITSASLSTNSVTITGGAANSVAYLNGSKVLTTGSALTFDGSKLLVSSSSEQFKLLSSGDFTSTGSGYIRWYDSVGSKGYLGYIGTANTMQLSTGGSGFNLNLQATGSIIFEASAAERMRLDASGNLLATGGFIPTNTSRLVVRGYSAISYNNTFSTANATVQIISDEMSVNQWYPTVNITMVRQSLTTGANAFGGIGFSTIDDSNNSGMYDAGRIAIVNDTGSAVASGTSMAFYTQAGSSNTVNAAIERMRITSTGFVGIGTTSPELKLHVSDSNGSGSMQLGSNAASQYQYFNFGGSAGGQNAWQIGKADASGSIAPSQGFYLYDLKNSVTRMVVNTSGWVGIGITSPLAKLDIKGDTTTFAGMAKIYLTDSNSNAGSRNWSIGNGGSGFGNLTFAVSAAKDGNAGDNTATNAMVLTRSGSLTLAGSIFPAIAYSYSIDTSSWSANTFYTIVPTGHLSNYTTYWVTVRWDHGGGGGPFIMATAFMFSVVNTNGSGTDNTFTPLTSSHTGGGGVLSFRSLAGSGSTTGLQASANSIVPGTMTVYLYRFV